MHVGSGWQPMPDKGLRVAQWEQGVRPLIAGDERARVIFDSTGLADRPLDLRLERDGRIATVHIGATGEVRVDG
jgi:general secretion pathway protein H